ncbi:MAG: hypothetical protein KIT33_06105 [Candidatus Kapabacteria bacterium]|nr:hypothetical protein [Ignavibacteriota bacterium]MCW5884529.1 hypothetical protein [Candidatus Kapabacteria bacterium]
MKFLYIFLLCLLSFTLVNAQDGLPSAQRAKEPTSFLEVPQILKTRVEVFFGQLMKDDVKKAYDNILSSSPISRQKADLDNLHSQTNRAFNIYGKLSGYEAVSAEIATSSYIRLRYLGLHGNFPVRWIFTFYKSPEKDWIVTNIKFDDLSEYFFKGD